VQTAIRSFAESRGLTHDLADELEHLFRSLVREGSGAPLSTLDESVDARAERRHPDSLAPETPRREVGVTPETAAIPRIAYR